MPGPGRPAAWPPQRSKRSTCPASPGSATRSDPTTPPASTHRRDEILAALERLGSPPGRVTPTARAHRARARSSTSGRGVGRRTAPRRRGRRRAWASTSSPRCGCRRARSARASCSRSTATWPSSRSSKAPPASIPTTVSVAFEGRPLEIPVGEGWLGRVWNGMGEPLDGGPPMLGATTRPVAGVAAQPHHPRRAPRPDPDRHLGDRRADHARARARSSRSSPRRGFRTSSSPPRSPPRPTWPASRSRSSWWPWDSPTPTPRRCATRSRPAREAGDLALFLDTGRRPRRPAGPRPARRADGGRAPRLRPGPARAGRAGRHDELLRGGARGVGGSG